MTFLTLPFNSHSDRDCPLYVVADLPTPSPTPDPSPEMSIASEHISSRADRHSAFFRALCEPHRTAPRSVGKQTPEPIAATHLPVDWMRGEPARSRPIVPPPLPFGDTLQKNIYNPHGKWEWATGLPFQDTQPSILLSSGVMCSAFLKTGKIGDREVKYVSKVWLTKEKWHGFYSELALYKVQLKSLQGRVVPAIINVYSYPGAVDVAMEPPHHSFWIEASSDMPHVLKKRCVQAFEKLHACGVYHGDVELRHMLIGGDAKVTIIDFQASRALVPNEAVQLSAATPDDLRMEMRKVKFKLDYEGARAWEDQKLMRRARLARRLQRTPKGAALEEAIEEDKLDPPVDTREWNLEWIGAPVNPMRFVIPGQSAEEVESAVEHFLSIIEKLEKEVGPDGNMTPQLKPPPHFSPPTAVAAPQPAVQPRGRGGFGATVLYPNTRGPRGLKRKGDVDVSQESPKRIRTATSTAAGLPMEPAVPFPVTAPPLTSGMAPPSKPKASISLVPPVIKVRDFAHELAPSPRPHQTDRVDSQPPLSDKPAVRSPGKRKRQEDASESTSDARARPKPRTSLAQRVATCDIEVIEPAVTSGLAPRPQNGAVKFSAPLFQWIGNLWKIVY
ncbi:hypothetical protein C8J57DRAFT_1210891 [Mycena rebaudengoi]|nr:hypothetical protein C8J57DRAFT_1210891 [Mycena rebaudengoi]